MIQQEDQEELLSQLAKTKLPRLDEISDEVLDFSDREEFWATLDGIQLGAGKKTIWKVEYLEDLVAVFIGGTFEEIKNKIESLPNRLTISEKQQVVAKVREIVPNARFIYIEPDEEDECKVIVDSLDQDFNTKQTINNMRLSFVVDPQKYIKKIPKGAVL